MMRSGRSHVATTTLRLGDNNTPMYIMWAALFVNSIIMLWHTPPALLLPERTPDWLYLATFGKEALKNRPPDDALSWATGTWLWDITELVLVVVAIPYTLYALNDERHAIYQWVLYLVNRRRVTSGGVPLAPGGDNLTFGRLLFVELLGETIAKTIAGAVRSIGALLHRG